MKLTYIPVEDLEEPVTRADLARFFDELQFLYQKDKEPEEIIQIDDER